MTTAERDQLIMEKLNSGMSMSDVQKLLDNEYGIKLTYLDLRLIVSDMKIQWENQERQRRRPVIPAAQPAPKPQAPQPAADPQEEEDFGEDDVPGEMEDEAQAGENAGPAGIFLTMDDEPAPGAAMSGSVKFASGASGKWMLDRFGRLGMSSLDEGSSQPTQEDYQDFSAELQNILQKRQIAMQQKAFDGRTKVEISALVKPGCDMNGTVTFASGAHGEWMIVQGKIDFELAEDSSKPSQEDLSLFQIVLSKELQEKGYQ